ncbi:hypothetical protein [Furfurilactobacillus entadae]|uniref:hypothetical protein n=1 Tax=Furfurilactobacillus entadae TaxID=2922307 RepID=UPI0035E9F29F
MTTRYRDLTVLPLTATTTLVVACDSSAGIGEKQADMVTIDVAIMAAYSLRVPLLELMCYGATPLMVVDTIGNEMKPTGVRMIAGLRQELATAGLADLPINGSTEDNMTTITSSIGVTVIGQAKTRPVTTDSTDLLVYQLGTPYVGEAVKTHLAEIFTYEDVRHLLTMPMVTDLLPVGSKGIQNELGQMATTHHATVELVGQQDEAQLTASAGPATVLLIAIEATAQEKFAAKVGQPVQLIARLKQGENA